MLLDKRYSVLPKGALGLRPSTKPIHAGKCSGEYCPIQGLSIFLRLFLSLNAPGSRANPEKISLVNFRGPDRRKFSELCVLLCFLGKTHKMPPQNPGLVNQFSATPRLGSTQIDRPHCKLLRFQC